MKCSGCDINIRIADVREANDDGIFCIKCTDSKLKAEKAKIDEGIETLLKKPSKKEERRQKIQKDLEDFDALQTEHGKTKPLSKLEYSILENSFNIHEVLPSGINIKDEINRMGELLDIALLGNDVTWAKYLDKQIRALRKALLKGAEKHDK